jgi:hypothetical protein
LLAEPRPEFGLGQQELRTTCGRRLSGASDTCARLQSAVRVYIGRNTHAYDYDTPGWPQGRVDGIRPVTLLAGQ